MYLSNTHFTNRRFHQQGVTLVELLVGLAVGLIVLAGVTFSWSLSIQNNAYILSVSALNNDMRSAMQIMSQDIRRATATETDDRTVEISADNSCIVFNSHVSNESIGADIPPSIDLETLIPSGYRLNNGNLQMWFSITEPPVESFDQCDSGTSWESIIESGDRGINITNLTFDASRSRCLKIDESAPGADINGPCPAGSTDRIELLLVDITLTGSIQNAGVTRTFTLNDTVKIRNDHVY